MRNPASSYPYYLVESFPTKRRLTGSSFPTLMIGWRHTWPQVPLNSNLPLSRRGGRSSIRSSGGYKPYTLRPMPRGINLRLYPSGLNMCWNGYHKRGRTYIYSPLAGIPHPFGRTIAGKQILDWRWGITQIYPPSYIIATLVSIKSAGRMYMMGP